MIIHISKQAKRKLDTLAPEQINTLFATFIQSKEPIAIAKLSCNTKTTIGANLPLSRQNESELKRISSIANIHLYKLGAIICTHMLGSNGLESYYQAALQQELGGIREVPVPSGRVDLVTNTHCIEVKVAPKWKAALGQALAYHVYMKGLRPAVALIGKLGAEQRAVCQQVCRDLGVDVIWMQGQSIKWHKCS